MGIELTRIMRNYASSNLRSIGPVVVEIEAIEVFIGRQEHICIWSVEKGVIYEFW